MSRTRIVKGKVTEITGGTYRIYGNRIIINSGGRIDYFAKNYTYGDPGEPPVSKYADFDIHFEIDKEEKTIVPFGIVDFENKAENQFFRFKYTLEKSDIDEFYFEIITERGDQLYEYNCLKPAVIDNEYKEPLFKSEKTSKIPMNSALIPEGSPDFEPKDYTAMGSYTLSWDGFDKDGIYDSTRFNNKDLKARITAIKNGRRKSIVVDFSTKYDQVEWTDVKIDKNTKRIDLSLRVNLTDGGENGLTCQAINASDIYGMPARTVCDWDKIPKSEINSNNPIIKIRTRSFEELKQLAFAGLEHYWGRNKSRVIGNYVKINDNYEVFINAINSNKNALNSLPLIYNTNGDWMRSGNPGGNYFDESLADNIIDSFPDAGVIQRLSYNVGYIEYSNGWGYSFEKDEDEEFKETASHELGHELLQAYSGTAFSYQHKGSSYYFPQDTKPTKGNETVWDIIKRDKMPESSGENYPLKGEVDLMKYYNNDRIKDKSRTIAAEKDVLGLIWLTKIKVK
ncbi:hypothetical protein L0669_15420 [Flavobacterium bizetiae]|uniref:hypothetical protein n=1 Tax=Flavobacterium bizetiae TaxID=2704140 RepID=UPI0021E9661B|nr:hypothetical protein [Flavobacterium bizetiae]UTN02713.1 hypothetical protein L0669_15420 [Flavobacterium bizetiae]